jgi:hypothetical protein
MVLQLNNPFRESKKEIKVGKSNSFIDGTTEDTKY